MSGVDVLENLDNNALRAKCLQYGLPNVPITDTSRKLLIRRLRAAIEAGEKPQEIDKPTEKEKPKNRRETIHATKVTTTTETTSVKVSTPTKPRTAARKTIAATENRVVHEDSPAKPRTPTQKRRTSRNTPISQPDEIPEPLQRKAAVIEEEDDTEEEEDDIIIVDDPVLPRSTRSSRSSSLSKSPVVRTSFSHIQPDPIDDEPEVESEGEPVKEHIIWPKHVPSTRTYDNSKPFVPTVVTRESPISYTKPIRSSHLGGTKQNLSQAPTSTFSYDSSDYRRSYVDYKAKTPLKNETKRDTEPDDELESPYLSDFARRLSRLKAEPLEPVLAVKREISQQREIPRLYPSTIGGRRSISQKDSVGESFQKLLIALDHKYNLRRNLFIGGTAFVFILAYILFAH